jgi:hypothetical protein
MDQSAQEFPLVESRPLGLSQARIMFGLRDATRRKTCATVPARWWSSAVLGSSAVTRALVADG